MNHQRELAPLDQLFADGTTREAILAVRIEIELVARWQLAESWCGFLFHLG